MVNLKQPEKTSSPLVSVLIPSYNSKEYITDCILSVLAQSYPNYEIIVVDDCSDDGSYELVKELASEHKCIKYTQTTANTGGPATPRNSGIELAQGELIAFLDADDMWHPNKLQRQVELLAKTKADMVCSSILLLDARTNQKNSFDHLPLRQENCSERLYFRKLIKKNRVALSSTIVRRTSLGDERFSTLEKHIAVEDYHLWLRLLANKDFVALLSSDKLVVYRQSNDSLSASKLTMAKKVFMMLDDFDLSYVWFGLGKSWYFTCYCLLSVYRQILPRTR